VEKYGGARQGTGESMAHVLFVLNYYGYRHAHSECVTLLDFPQQQRFRELASVLSYKPAYIACLVVFKPSTCRKVFQ
jgi:hypothetical protein